MFTGIIQSVATITDIHANNKSYRLTIEASRLPKNLRKGSSVAVDGVCLTVCEDTFPFFSFDIIPETINSTHFKHKKKGDLVNLEPALRLNSALDGHLVIGHVDTACRVLKKTQNKSEVILALSFPKTLSAYIVQKGSITINGVSLTVQKFTSRFFTVHLIPYTLQSTNLRALQIGEYVNIEVDILSRYISHLFRLHY
ncbi:riboflavin synthase [Candidatus Peregrinibacteria bacterium]|nr:riboflavin synthase [Candidatus Peregrinibacteria bacterium]